MASNLLQERKTTMDEPMDDASEESLNPEREAALDTLVEAIDRCWEAVGLGGDFNAAMLLNAEGYGNLSVGRAGSGEVEIETLPRSDNEAWPLWHVWSVIRKGVAGRASSQSLLTHDALSSYHKACERPLAQRVDRLSCLYGA